jgi:hypothetical protein
MSRSSTKIGFFRNKHNAGAGTPHVPVATIVSETLSNATFYPEFMTYNMAFSTNFAPNTTIGYTITGTATASEFYGGLSGTTTLDANANGNLSITTNVNPSATDGSTKTFAVNLTTTSYDKTFASSNSHTLTGTPGYAIQFVSQGSYATELSTVTISGVNYNLRRMDYANGNVITSTTDPRGFTQNTIREQKYEIKSNQNPAPLEVLVIGGGGSASYGYNNADPAGGGGGAQIIEANANVTVDTVYDFEVGSNGRYTWLFDNGGDSSYTYWSTGPNGKPSTAFANSSYSLPAREGQGAYGQSGRGGTNGGPGWAAGGGGGAGNLFGGNTGPGIPTGGPFPGIGGYRYGQANTAPTATANATMTQGGSGDDGNSSNFNGTTTFYGAGGAGSGDGSANNGTNGNGIDNYGSGGHAFKEGDGSITITDSKPGTIYIKHLANGDRRIILN